jgi:hypothetical protein
MLIIQLGHYVGLEVHDVGANGNLLYAFESKHRDVSYRESENFLLELVSGSSGP